MHASRCVALREGESRCLLLFLNQQTKFCAYRALSSSCLWIRLDSQENRRLRQVTFASRRRLRLKIPADSRHCVTKYIPGGIRYNGACITRDDFSSQLLSENQYIIEQNENQYIICCVNFYNYLYITYCMFYVYGEERLIKFLVKYGPTRNSGNFKIFCFVDISPEI